MVWVLILILHLVKDLKASSLMMFFGIEPSILPQEIRSAMSMGNLMVKDLAGQIMEIWFGDILLMTKSGMEQFILLLVKSWCISMDKLLTISQLELIIKKHWLMQKHGMDQITLLKMIYSIFPGEQIRPTTSTPQSCAKMLKH